VEITSTEFRGRNHGKARAGGETLLKAPDHRESVSPPAACLVFEIVLKFFSRDAARNWEQMAQ
jgi:hypothetical protein